MKLSIYPIIVITFGLLTAVGCSKNTPTTITGLALTSAVNSASSGSSSSSSSSSGQPGVDSIACETVPLLNASDTGNSVCAAKHEVCANVTASGATQNLYCATPASAGGPSVGQFNARCCRMTGRATAGISAQDYSISTSSTLNGQNVCGDQGMTPGITVRSDGLRSLYPESSPGAVDPQGAYGWKVRCLKSDSIFPIDRKMVNLLPNENGDSACQKFGKVCLYSLEQGGAITYYCSSPAPSNPSLVFRAECIGY